LRRGWLFPFFGLLLGLVAGLAYLIVVPPTYTSSARILLERSVSRFLQSNNIADEPTLDDSDIASQLYVLSSDSIVLPIVRSMGLAHDPEFVGRPRQEEDSAPSLADCMKAPSISCAFANAKWGAKSLVREAKQLIGLKSGVPIDPEAASERLAVDKLLTRLTIVREDVPSVIDVNVSSQDPKKAADIANAIADTYVASIADRKLKSNKMISRLLEERLVDLKKQYLDADRALQEFRTAHNFSNPIPDNQLISTLRSQYVSLAAKASQIEDVVGPTHSAVIKLRKQMDELDAAIRSEEQRIASSADQHSPSPNEQFADTGTSDQGMPNSDSSATMAPLDSQSHVKLRQLEASATTLRSLYNTAQRQFSEVSQVRPDTQDAHIITRATPPLEMSSKKRLVIFAGGIMFGLLAGVGAALGREWLADVFRTPEQLKNAIGLYTVVLPTIEGNAKGLNEYVLDAPYSRFTETFRNVRALISAFRSRSGCKVICVVSSVSQEGKTTVANNLAALISASAYRTLLMDCDLHRWQMTMELAPDAEVGLAEALREPARLAEFVFKRERSGVDVLPFAHSERLPNAAELLGSAQMEKLLNAAREKYDFIVLEVAPIMSVVDVKMMERFVDQFVFIVEWGETKRRLVLEALAEVEGIRDRIVCAVLNKAESATLKNIEAYRGSKIESYYVS
jgi:succinoglycan biosynthesis transport protein ExoP